ncbi:hypothetical protein C8Q70DRAFT_209506 [Cubamyces menziesii]|uniref:EthD domain-containing protein n=1 Tax=Trametes cubensis TaxID=1111947 RepID=A0AAD7TNX8_9APHY|nr:hypothetical protein C8Q70DRAFT_209506 [Cubamyces menziesii]KAJ8472806.1 hypothetical protein ONZ51_g8266 [Trametes cubensis]
MPALLFVYAEPGSVPDEEFNDWLDNEHVPLRVAVPGFQSWSRWAAVDGERPTYAGVYDLTSPDVLTSTPYTDLAQTRTEREEANLARIGLLDRRTYELLEPVYPPKNGDEYDPLKPGPYASIVEVDVKPEGEEEFNRWYDEEHIPMVTKVPGWLRSRRFVLLQCGAIGAGAADAKPLKYLAIHEWEIPPQYESAEMKAAMATEWSKKVMGNILSFRRRRLRLLRTWSRA